MSQETNVILRSILYHAIKAKTKEEIERSIRAMSDPVEVVAVIEKQLKDEAAQDAARAGAQT
ncbi:hypothetical protein FACS18949_17730 [Clostridia bacterium]|nr:hypothetical protein FACS18949_17730 [Clostridia bacterium]